MKWIRRVCVTVIILVCGLGVVGIWTALKTNNPVGFQLVQGRSSDGKPLVAGVWYPTQKRPWPTVLFGLRLMSVAKDAPVAGANLPLVVISHGTGGGPGGHADLAMALANAGYVVAAPMHLGDNYADQRALASASWLSDRNRELVGAVDFMLKSWRNHDRIDPERIGAYGFSAGGFTVLTVVGAQPDLGLITKHCSESPEFACDLLRQTNSPLLHPNTQGGNAFLSDPRIKSASVAAPGLGFTMAQDRLSAVRVPVQLWNADNDQSVPYATNAKVVSDGLGQGVEVHRVPGAGHFSFLIPCVLLGPPLLCSDGAGFDRKAFHDDMNLKVIRFFDRTLKGA